MPASPRRPAAAGFTLVELAVVLVVIGLLAGGVLSGQYLVHAARLQRTAGQVAQFDTAVNVFQVRFACLPGDCKNAEARGLFPPTTDPVKGGNGDGMVGATGMGDEMLAYEPVYFWQELYTTGLLADNAGVSYGGTGCRYDGGLWNWSKYGTCSPLSALPYAGVNSNGADYHRAAMWTVRDYPDAHYYQLTTGAGNDAGFRLQCGDGTGIWSWCNALTPADAAALDRKLDDGRPTSGAVLAYSAPSLQYTAGPQQAAPFLNNPTTGPAGGSTCVTDATPPAYNISNPDLYRCSLNVAAGF